MEGVARARRVVAAAGHREGGRLDEDAAVVDDRAALAQRHPDDRVRAQLRFHLDEGGVLVVHARQPARELVRRDEHVHVRQKLPEPFVDVVDVERDDGAGRARLARDAGAGARVVPVHVEHAPARAEAGRRLVLFVGEARVPVPDDGALARALVDEDVCDLVGRALDDLCELHLHALGPQRLEAEAAGVVRAEAARVGRPHPEPS